MFDSQTGNLKRNTISFLLGIVLLSGMARAERAEVLFHAFQNRIEQVASPKVLERLRAIKIDNFGPEVADACALLHDTSAIFDEMEKALSVEELHVLLAKFRASSESLSEFREILRALLEFNLGLKTINLLLPSSEYSLENELLTKFYRDENHPMDLQNFIRHPIMSYEVAAVIKNLSQLVSQIDVDSPAWLKPKEVGSFNAFMKKFIQLRRVSDGRLSLLDLETNPPNIEGIRSVNQAYFWALGFSPNRVATNLAFSTNEQSHSIYLFPQDDEPQIMDGKTFYMNERSGETFLRVPEADNRVVRISGPGFKALQKIHAQSKADLVGIERRIRKRVAEQDIVVTSRTKSVVSILDKAGRLAALTQLAPSSRYETVMDIIDINGVRITCFDSTQIRNVISKLEGAGFEIFELDNKYNTIRKDGAHKVVPLTLWDFETNNVFELQITTMSSATVSDLFHNAVYKREAIGLNLTDSHRNFILKAQRASALVETLNLINRVSELARPMSAVEYALTLMSLRVRGVKMGRAKSSSFREE